MYIMKMCKDKSLLVTRSQPIYQGENNSDTIDFFIPKEYNQKDISEASVRLNYLLPNGVSGYIYLNKDEDDYDNFSLYHFVITTMFTHFAGRVVFWLTLLKDEELTILQTSQGYFDVIEKIDVDYGTHGEHEVDERLIQIQNLQATTIRQLTELKEMILNFNIPSIVLKVDDLATKIDMLESQCNYLINTKLDTSTANELVQEQRDILDVLDKQLYNLQIDINNVGSKIDKTFTQEDRRIFEELQTKVTMQQQRIKTLESNMSIEVGRLDRTQLSVNNNKTDIDNNRARIGDISTSVDRLTSDISTINDNINGINERIDSLNQPIALISEDISQKSDNPSILDTQVMRLEDIGCDTNDKGIEIDSTYCENPETEEVIIDNTQVGVINIDDSNAQNIETTNIDTGLSQIRAVMGDIQASIDDIHTDVNVIQTNVGKLQTLEEQKDSLYNMQAVMGDMPINIDNITTNACDLKAVVGDIQIQASAIESSIPNLDTKVYTLDDISNTHINEEKTKQLLSHSKPVGSLTDYLTN